MPKPYHTPKSERDEILGALAEAEQAAEGPICPECDLAGHTVDLDILLTCELCGTSYTLDANDVLHAD
jgi:hypothetical protein